MLARRGSIFESVRKQKNCEFSLKYILSKENDVWKALFSMLTLVKKGTRAEVDYKYDECVLVEKLLDIEKSSDVISNLQSEKDRKGSLSIPRFGKFLTEGLPPAYFVPSKQTYGVLRSAHRRVSRRMFRCDRA